MFARNSIRFAFLFILFHASLVTAAAQQQTNCAVQGDIPQTECQALLAFFDGTGGVNWTNNMGWDEDNSPCSWFGVVCESGTVRQLSLVGNQLSGRIPTQIGNLTNLINLDLRINQIGRSIPSEIGNLTSLLVLALGFNQLSGEIPTQVGDLSQLFTLGLSFNQLSGSIPSSIGNLANLVNLLANGNQLSGQIPPEIGNLTNLDLLVLNDNSFTGSLPSEIGNLANVTFINLTRAGVSGPIPTAIGNLSKVNTLELNFNAFSGTIPTQIGNLSSLATLHLGGNRLSGNIPSQIGSLSRLESLILDQNQLDGSIPAVLGSLSNLSVLALGDNQLSGSIPSALGNLSNLTSLSLDQNQLTGSIPSELGNLTSLTSRLGLGFNQLTGSIPSQLGNLINLADLDLSSNQLTGSIPPELGSLASLQRLLLFGNELGGTIPPELGNLTNLTDLFLDSNQLTGSIPPELGNLTNLTSLFMPSNQLGDPVPLPVAMVGAATNGCSLLDNLPSLCMANTPDFQALVDQSGLICGLALACETGADLVLEKKDSVDPVIQGQTFEYTLTVTNRGPDAAADVVVTDNLPAGLTLVSTSGCGEDPAGAPTCTLGSIAANNSAQYTISVTADASGGLLENTATVASSTEENEPGDETASEFTAVGMAPIPLPPGGVADGLSAWFRADQGVIANGTVSAWLDLSGSGRHASQSDPGRQPVLSNTLNGLPTVRFSEDSLPFDGTFLANKNYTIFTVEGRDRFGFANFFLAGRGQDRDQNLILGYETEILLRWDHFANNLDLFVDPYQGTQDYALTTFRLDTDEGRRIYRSGLIAASDSSTAQLTSFEGAALGSFPAFETFFGGDIAEIAIYDRALSCQEIILVNQELADRWGQAFTLEFCPTPGDLNRDGLVDALDVSALVQELNDDDGEAVADVATGTFPGTADFDLNGDDLITIADIEVLAELIFDPPDLSEPEASARERLIGLSPQGGAAGSVLDFPRLAVEAGNLTGMAIANPGAQDAALTFRAYGENGALLAEDSNRNVPGGQQLSLLTSELFPGLPAGTVAWFQATSPVSGLSGFFLELNFATFAELDGADLPPRARRIVFNTVQTSDGASTELNVVNPGNATANVTLTLISGEDRVERDIQLPAKGVARMDAATLFGLNDEAPAGANDSSRYILAEANQDLLGFEFIRAADGDLQGLNARSALELLNRIYIPQLAVLGIIESELGLVNYSAQRVIATITAHKTGGDLFGAGEVLTNPVTIALGPGESIRQDVATMFGFQGGDTVQGWLEIESSQAINGFLAYRVPVTGAAAAVSAVAQGTTTAIFSHLATVGDFYTGVAALNPSSYPVNLRIIALSVTGEVLGTFDTVLAPGQRLSDLISNMIPGADDRGGGLILMRTNYPSIFVSLFGTFNGKTFANIPPPVGSSRVYARCGVAPGPGDSALECDSAGSGPAVYGAGHARGGGVEGQWCVGGQYRYGHGDPDGFLHGS